MVKRWRSYLSLLVSFAFILSMLFCDTLKVNAQGVESIINHNLFYNKTSVFSDDVRVHYVTDSPYVDYQIKATGSGTQYYPTTYNIFNQGLNSGHVKIPYCFYFGDTGQAGWNTVFDWGDWDEDAYYLVNAYFGSMVYSWSDGSTTRQCIFDNIRFSDNNGRLWCAHPKDDLSAGLYTYVRGRDFLNFANNSHFPLVLQGYLEFDYNITDTHYTVIEPDDNLVMIVHPSFNYYLWSLKDAYKYDVGSINVTDSITQQELNKLNQSTDAIEDSTTNPNGTGILGTIKNFFGGFFGWLKDLLLGLFIPDSDYFSTWFSNLNALLSAKLGMLYAPFDLLITVLNSVYSSSTDFSGVPFPEIKWGDTVLIGSQNLTFSSLLGEHFSEIQGYVYFATDVVLLFAFLMLLQRKVSLILRGHESG